MTGEPPVLGIIAGSGLYPACLIQGARRHLPGVIIHAVAFEGETNSDIEQLADNVCWARVGQFTKPLKFFKKNNVRQLVMTGQLAPKNLFNLRPDIKALMILARLPRRNAETLFGAVDDEADKEGIHVLPANSFMEEFMARPGHIAGPLPSERQLEDARYGMEVAKEVSRLDIGQSVIVRHGTVLAVEGFEGTNDCIRRGAKLGRGRNVTLAKVSKPRHDMRFDVPVIGMTTMEVCHEAGVEQIIVEAGGTIILQLEEIEQFCRKHKITVYGM